MSMDKTECIKFYNVIVLGLGFFSLFTAFQTSGLLQVSTVNNGLMAVTNYGYSLLQPTSLSSYFSKDCVSCNIR